jgi:hypothetical protein
VRHHLAVRAWPYTSSPARRGNELRLAGCVGVVWRHVDGRRPAEMLAGVGPRIWGWPSMIMAYRSLGVSVSRGRRRS